MKSKAESAHQKLLYHGTSLSSWKAIQACEKLAPRGDAPGNWQHTVSSHRDAVYLTSVYGAYFAACASRQHEPGVLLEVEVAELDVARWGCDEDAYALLDLRQQHPDRSLEQLVEFAKADNLLGLPLAIASLRLMGTCAYFGDIPLKAVKRAVILDWSQNPELAHVALEPVIAPINYRLCGAGYRRLTTWLLGDSEPSVIETELVPLNLPRSRAGLVSWASAPRN